MHQHAPVELDGLSVKAAQHAVVVRRHDAQCTGPVLVDIDAVGDPVLVRRRSGAARK